MADESIEMFWQILRRSLRSALLTGLSRVVPTEDQSDSSISPVVYRPVQCQLWAESAAVLLNSEGCRRPPVCFKEVAPSEALRVQVTSHHHNAPTPLPVPHPQPRPPSPLPLPL